MATRDQVAEDHRSRQACAMTKWKETSYPVPREPLRVRCLSCGVAIAGGRRGTANIRSILKEVKAHDGAQHPPYDPQVISVITQAVAELNSDLPRPRRAGRLAIDFAFDQSTDVWRREAEKLEQHVGQLLERRSELERAVVRLAAERTLALEIRQTLRRQLIEAQKEIDVLTGLRASLRAELVKSHPSRRQTGLLAEVAKAAAAAVVASVIAVGAQWASEADQVAAPATNVVTHAEVVINNCHAN